MAGGLGRRIRREGPLLAAVFLPVMLAWLPVIVGAKSVCDNDTFYEHVPFRAYAEACLARHELPLWAPGIRAGYPLHANGEAALLSPIELPLRLVLAPRDVIDVTCVLATLLGAGLAAALVRGCGASRPAAALSGIGYGLSGPVVTGAFPHAIVVAAVLPGALLAILRILRRPEAPLPVLGLAAAVGTGFLAGRPQVLAIVAPLGVAWAVVELLATARAAHASGGSAFAALTRSLKPLLLGTALGVCLGAPQALPTLALVATSDRGPGLPEKERDRGAATSGTLTDLVFPDAAARGQRPAAQVGFVLLGLALVGSVTALARRRDANERRIVFLIAAAALGLSLAFGDASPVFRLTSSLPVLRSLRFPYRFLLIFATGTTLAGGLALDRIARPRVRLVLVLFVAIELVCHAWQTIAWASPELYEAEPSIVTELRALPRDESGAQARYDATEEAAFATWTFASLPGPSVKAIVETQDWLNGDRALAFGLSYARGYGEPVSSWQREFLAGLTNAREDALGVAATVVAPRKGARSLTLRKTALPRALVVARGVTAAGVREAREALEIVDPRACVVLEEPVAAGGSAFEGRAARIVASGPNDVTIEVDSPGEGWLVFFDAWDPGWRASVGERETKILRAFGFFRAVRVPAGVSRVVFRYRPVELEAGLWLAVLGLVGCVGYPLLKRRSLPSEASRVNR